MAAFARHETRALLRAHLSAASGYRHLTRHCPVCHRLLRLALEPGRDPRDPSGGPETAQGAPEGESPPTARPEPPDGGPNWWEPGGE